MARKKSSGTGVGVGGSSILVIFILLCLTTFATLSLVSAGADLRLTEKTAQATREYYAADAAAEETLAEIARAAAESYRTPAYPQAVLDAVPEAEITPEGDALRVRYSVPMGVSQELAVALRVYPANPPETRFARERWQVVTTDEWEPESDGFNLWGGGEGAALGDGLPPGFPG